MAATTLFLAGAHPAVAAAPSADGAAYLGEQTAVARAALDRGDPAVARLALDKSLSLIASLSEPQVDPIPVAMALSEAISLLTQAGDVERAWGLYKAGGEGIGRTLPGSRPAGALWRLREARLLQQVGDAAGALKALEAADGSSAEVLTLRAGLKAAVGDLPGARAVLASHPFAPLYARPGRAPANDGEIAYLFARALVDGLGQTPEPEVAAALAREPAFAMDEAARARAAVYRVGGQALAEPPGASRQARLAELGRLIREASRLDPAWRRPGVVDQMLIALALTQAPGATGDRADIAFSLFQLAGRSGPVFDADALAVLAQARDDLQRRTLHQALRLRARRDRLERIQVQRVASALAPARGAAAKLRHDAAARLLLRDFDERIRRAQALLARDGVDLDPPLAPLSRLQAVLGPDEAALAVSPSVGGLAYMCIRRDGTTQVLGAADPVKLKLDTRLVQAALTATYPASEELDTQFPVEAAGRIYDALVRPFEPCLKAGDRLVWLSSAATAGAPLAVLLRQPPPKLERGWDLGAADWLVRRHAISYAGSAAVVLAARSGAHGRAADLDFLGVGDPVLPAAPATSPSRGVRIEGLAPLPETKDELEASARGFARSRLLMQAAATERGFRSEMVGAYRYLSFATHGLIRDDLQGLAEPALVLTPVTPSDPLDDGLLTANEIADLDLSAVFVALSACNTANFDQAVLAQELPALTSAFAVAGAPATLATLWPVDSETGKQVVSGVFARLRAGAGPAAALAEAQRAFLAAPPGRAYFHPRFWAPFVVLGDGAAATVRPAAPALTSVEILTRGGGEVLALSPARSSVAARFIGDGGLDGRRAEAVRLVTPSGEAWRRASPAGAARFLAPLGGRLVAGGYAPGNAGRYVPTLTAHDPATGAPTGVWKGDGVARVDAFLLAGLATSPQTALIAVGELNLRDAPEAGGGRVQVLQVDAALAPRPLFEAAAPPGTRISDAALALLGGKLLLAYSGESPQPPLHAAVADDYETPLCGAARTTWLELRDPATGGLLAAETLPDVAVVTALTRAGAVVLGGYRQAPCEPTRAVLLEVGRDLRARPVYLDETLGASQVRTLVALPGGRLLAAASKESVVDYAPPDRAAAARADPYALKPFSPTFAGMLITLGPAGPVGPPKLLESGSNIYGTALAATPVGEVLLGGSLAGQAAIFHFAQ